MSSKCRPLLAALLEATQAYIAYENGTARERVAQAEQLTSRTVR